LNNALGPEMQPVDMTHSGKPEFVVLKLGESGKPKVVSPWGKAQSQG